MKIDVKSRPFRFLWIVILVILLLTGCRGAGKEAEQATPDGNEIEYTLTPMATAVPLDIFFLEDTLTQVTFNLAGDSDPTWSPDGEWIAFSSNRDGDYDIYLVNASCLDTQSKCDQNPIALTDDRIDNWSPAWSPDSKKIAYTNFQDELTKIFIVTVDCILSSGPQEVCTQELTIQVEDLSNIRSPAWSPDGNRIVFASSHETKEGIYVSDTMGTELMRLTDYPSDYPEWSPDGDWIVYSAEYLDAYEIYIMKSDGTGQRRLTYNFEGSWNPTWSPDGRWIAYDVCCFAVGEVRIFDALCGMQSEVDDPDCYETGIAQFPFEMSPAWSPDGKKMLFVELGAGNDNLYLISAMTQTRSEE